MLVVFCLVEAALLWYCFLTDGPFRARGLIAVNMVLISFFAAKMMATPIGVTNVSTVLYATVVLAQFLILKRYGRDAAVGTLRMTMFALIAALSLGTVIALIPTVIGNELDAFAVDAIASTSLQVVLASLFAFIIGQSILVLVGEKHGMFITTTATQLVDSALFFPIAFGALDGMYEIMAVGFAVKVVATLVVYSFYKSFDSISMKYA